MRPYTVTVEVKTKWTIEVHAQTDLSAMLQAEGLDLDNIENAGEFVEMVGVEATGAELLYPEDEDEDTASEEAVDPAADTADGVEVRVVPLVEVTLNPDGTIAEQEMHCD